MRLLVLVAALALAGCAAPAATEGPATSAPESRLDLVDCEQTHTFAPYPVEAFAGTLPDGWTLQPADAAGRTTQFYLAGSRCASASAAHAGANASMDGLAEVWGYLFVVPPGGADANYSGELWPLGAVVTHDEALRVYEAWGFGGLVVQGAAEVATLAETPAAVASRTRSDAGGETFEVTAAVRPQPAPFHDGTFRVWVPSADADGVAGAIVYAWNAEGQQVGLGGGTLRYEGELLNAPPAGPVVVHHVRGVPVTVTRAAA